VLSVLWCDMLDGGLKNNRYSGFGKANANTTFWWKAQVNTSKSQLKFDKCINASPVLSIPVMACSTTRQQR